MPKKSVKFLSKYEDVPFPRGTSFFYSKVCLLHDESNVPCMMETYSFDSEFQKEKNFSFANSETFRTFAAEYEARTGAGGWCHARTMDGWRYRRDDGARRVA